MGTRKVQVDIYIQGGGLFNGNGTHVKRMAIEHKNAKRYKRMKVKNKINVATNQIQDTRALVAYVSTVERKVTIKKILTQK